MNDPDIRTLITEWARAVQQEDLDGVLAHHSDDIVMFDVPAPEQGRRGLDDYSASWTPLFKWIHTGAHFEITELHVEHCDDFGVAWALLQCGTTEDLTQDPDRRLRLSFGLRRHAGTWQISHEHHSFTHR
ncbi:YybH family protein [Brachybacterium tyrofermentans]|uniref:YybH family protein n=1 Tax=Brachybacterium tyrofermentans TaxID=47848 RepID=UPI0018674388|nr:SgcJ/EcaC family oxidoreductase [Brachybacterium tyrofermentans]